MRQLEFKETKDINDKLYICSTCKTCLNSCNVYTISNSCVIYCKMFKKQSK